MEPHSSVLRQLEFLQCLWLFAFGRQGELLQRTPTIVIYPGRLGPVIFQRDDIKLLQNFFQKRKIYGKFPWAVCSGLFKIQLQIGQGTMDRACIMSEFIFMPNCTGLHKKHVDYFVQLSLRPFAVFLVSHTLVKSQRKL